jgi:hypothetical protein
VAAVWWVGGLWERCGGSGPPQKDPSSWQTKFFIRFFVATHKAMVLIFKKQKIFLCLLLDINRLDVLLNLC